MIFRSLPRIKTFSDRPATLGGCAAHEVKVECGLVRCLGCFGLNQDGHPRDAWEIYWSVYIAFLPFSTTVWMMSGVSAGPCQTSLVTFTIGARKRDIIRSDSEEGKDATAENLWLTYQAKPVTARFRIFRKIESRNAYISRLEHCTQWVTYYFIKPRGGQRVSWTGGADAPQSHWDSCLQLVV